jgi:hypothetical protein
MTCSEQEHCFPQFVVLLRLVSDSDTSGSCTTARRSALLEGFNRD